VILKRLWNLEDTFLFKGLGAGGIDLMPEGLEIYIHLGRIKAQS